MDKQIPDLSMWKINDTEWRIKNGLTTPEWIQYRNNHVVKFVLFGMICYLIGFVVGVIR